MSKRIVTGTIKQPNGVVWRNGLVTFALTKLTYVAGQSVPRTAQAVFSAETDAAGAFAIALEASDTANVRCQYRVTRPNGSTADFVLAAGPALDLDLLLAQQQVTDPSALALHGATPASATQLGHVIVGAGLVVDETGTVSLPGAALTETAGDARYQSQADAAGHAATLAAPGVLGHIQPGDDFLVDSEGKLHHSEAFLAAWPNADAVAAHVAQADPHAQYLNQTRGDARYIKSASARPPLSVFDLGVKGDGSNDFAALQAALEEAGAAVLRELNLPYTVEGYGLSEPLYHATEGLLLKGNFDALYRLPRLYGNFCGPLIACGKPGVNMSFTPSLLSGNGRCINLTEEQEWVTFSDLGVNLHGWTALTAELNVRAVGPTASGVDQYVNLFSSFGARSDNYFGTETSRAFQLSVDAEGKILAYLTVGGVLKTLGPTAAGTFAFNVNSHLALSWDGTTARLFVNGVLKASVAAGGTLTQRVSEDVFIGRFPLAWPDFASAQRAQPGQYCNIRLSDTARYTAAFTPPTAEFTPDAHARILATFDHIARYPLLRVSCGAGEYGWLVARSAYDSNYTHNVGLQNLQLENGLGPTLLMQNCPTARIQRVAVTGRGTAAWFCGQKFLSEYRHLRATGGDGGDYKVGLCWSGPPGAGSRLVSADVQGFGYGLAASDGVSSIDRSFLRAWTNTIAPLYWHQGKAVFNDLWIDLENDPVGVTREATAIFSGMQSATFNGGAFNTGAGVTAAHPHIKLDFAQEYATLNLLGTRFTRITGDAVIAIAQGVRNNGRININVLGAQKLDSFFGASSKPWLVQSDADYALLRENGRAPRLTTAQRDSLPTSVKEEGLAIYNLTAHAHQVWNGTTWV